MLPVKIAWSVPMEVAAVPQSIIHRGSLYHLELFVPLGNYSGIQIVFLSKSFNIFPESSSSLS
jgi:hypothetical protein